MKALKSFIDSNQKEINRGDAVKKSDYRPNVWDVMLDRGLVAEPKANKMAKPKTTKAKK